MFMNALSAFMSACMYTIYVPGVQGCLRRTLEPLELELKDDFELSPPQEQQVLYITEPSVYPQAVFLIFFYSLLMSHKFPLHNFNWAKCFELLRLGTLTGLGASMGPIEPFRKSLKSKLFS